MDGQEIETKGTQDAGAESKRARVRRILIAPLQDQGMRFKKGTVEAVKRKRLDRMADDLGYMSDDALIVLRRCLLRNGEGAQKCFWPDRVSYLGYAHAFQYRCIDDDPAMLGWFASAAGGKAASVPGRAVAEYQFWCKHWHPPFDVRHKAAVERRAAQNLERLAYCTGREVEGRLSDPDDVAWLKNYRAMSVKVEGWIAAKVAA